MIRINIFYNEGTKNGRKYKVAHTLDFGYNLSISFQKGAEKLVQFDQPNNTFYIVYDPVKAGLRLSQSGYLELVIGI